MYDERTHYMRLDVIYNGAVEQMDPYDETTVWQAWNNTLKDLETNDPEGDWIISVYDERYYPPQRVTEHANITDF